MHPTPTHPPWCEFPEAPGDGAHIHTAAVGRTNLGRDVTVDVALTQAAAAPGPVLTLRMTGTSAGIGVDISGAQAWALAGVLIDAMVAHARAVPRPSAASPTAASRSPMSPQMSSKRPMWLLDRLDPTRTSRHLRSGSRLFRCRPAPDADYQPGPEDQSR